MILAKKADQDLKVFGAGSHKYLTGETVSNDQIISFEKEYNLELPEDYKMFLMHIGNGGISYQNAAAGPYYGIYPLGENVNEFIYENAKQYLNADCRLYPKMSDEFWSDLNKNIEDEELSDEDYDRELGELFSGLLPIVSQGCTYHNALVLNGDFRGRVVNVDTDRQKPFFAFESTFLDWYERWLDEIIPEEVTSKEPDLFQYTLGGSASYILEVFFATDNNETKLECLQGILKKQNVIVEVLNILEEQYKLSSGEQKKTLLQILTKFDYNRAKPLLIDFTAEDLLAVFQFVYWYAKDKSKDWLEIIKLNVNTIDDEETFDFCTYLLKEMNFDYGAVIVSFTTHESEQIRVSAYYSLGQLKTKSNYVDVFVDGLCSDSNRVIHTTLQALSGVDDQRLLKYYKIIAEKFPVEEDYILANLNHRLKPYGLTNKTIKRINTDFETNNPDSKWYQFWE
ncbi:SMI1 / KNR4 family (SUKH-1) [Flavobacterium hercynium]|nr:SMI1 / KNR4 family (SUKH-1) [Flavobacterium hercynium]